MLAAGPNVTSLYVTFEPAPIPEYQPEKCVLADAWSADCLPMTLQLLQRCCLLPSAALTAIPASSAVLSTDSCALQARTSSGGRQRFAGAGKGNLPPDYAAGSAAPPGLRYDLRCLCRCARQVAEPQWAQVGTGEHPEVLKLTAASLGECLGRVR